MVLPVARPGHGSPGAAYAVIFSWPCLLSGHVASKSHDASSSVSRSSNSRAGGNVKGWFARIKCVCALLEASTPRSNEEFWRLCSRRIDRRSLFADVDRQTASHRQFLHRWITVSYVDKI